MNSTTTRDLDTLCHPTSQHMHMLPPLPCLQNKLLICKFLDRLPGGWFSDAVTCLKLCREADADVVNMSFGDVPLNYIGRKLIRQREEIRF